MTIPVSQYEPPNGRHRDVFFTGDEMMEAKAKHIIDAGFRFTVELLNGAVVSMCIEHPDYGDVASRLCTNGPSVPNHFRDLIMQFDIAKSLEYWKNHA